ncbi:MAG: hypothetical protein ABMA01_04260, partial [Chthoniobacteraceae bacterium]
MLASRSSRRKKSTPKRDWRGIGVLVVFGMMVVLGPLAFGAVDRVVQTVLILLLAVGAFLRPPALVPLGRSEKILVITL